VSSIYVTQYRKRNNAKCHRILTPFELLGDAVLDKLTGSVFRTMAQSAAIKLDAEKARVNALNVFPVPDGDTGTNMSLTLSSAVDAVLASNSNSIGELAECAAQGALMGARGNSGVILSQFLRGFADGVAGLDEANSVELAQALVKAAEAAYGAVIKPVEGTVLTVGKEAAAEALRLAERGGDLLSVLEGALLAAIDTLAHTPDLLLALREAGVVDAGGEGLVVAAQGAFSALNGDAPPEEPKQTFKASNASVPDVQAYANKDAAPASVSDTPKSGIQETEVVYRYCTEFIIKGNNIDLAGIKHDLEDLGDSLLVVGQSNLVKVHVHTNHPGTALEICGVRGTLANIHINNMEEQNREAAKHEHDMSLPGEEPIQVTPEPVDTAVIAVANGAGCIELMLSLGCTAVVEGGQTLNPSTEEILAAIKDSGAKTALVLPNNKNVLMTARQAAHLSPIPVIVIPTKSFCQGVAAMLRFSPDEDGEENATKMEAAIDEIACGEITVAVRDAVIESRVIHEGEYLGISGGKILTTSKSINDATIDLISMLLTEDSGLITLYYGESVSEASAEDLQTIIADRFGVDVEIYPGGQPVYDYLLSVE
jgi:DAK2 domain fusion protein YloV